jgi:hypothetical protein
MAATPTSPTRRPARRQTSHSPADSPATGASTQVAPGPTDEQIRARAYQIFLARGGRPGDPDADWLQAERELRNTR